MIILICGVIVSSIALAIIGNILLWRSSTVFADSISHAFILSFVPYNFLGLPISLCNMIISIFFAGILRFLRYINLNRNVALMIGSNFCIALFSVIRNIFDINTSNVSNLLFGNIMFIAKYDIMLIFIVVTVVIAFIYKNFSRIVLSVFDEDLATLQGINVNRIFLIIDIFVGLVLSVSIASVGAMTASCNTIMPAIIAKKFASTPSMSIVYSVIFSIVFSCFAILLSFALDLPYSSVLVIEYVLFIVCVSFIKNN